MDVTESQGMRSVPSTLALASAGPSYLLPSGHWDALPGMARRALRAVFTTPQVSGIVQRRSSAKRSEFNRSECSSVPYSFWSSALSSSAVSDTVGP